MPTFEYRALHTDGAIAEGRIDASGRHEAFGLLAERGLNQIKHLILSRYAQEIEAEKGGEILAKEARKCLAKPTRPAAATEE